MYRNCVKRIFDIVISLVAMPFVLLEIIILAPIIHFTDNGPIFYNAERLGKNGKVFKMLKLRSMKVNSPNLRNADGSTYNGENDPRVTRIGRIMRKTSLDEFPQFLNVLIGDMSIIGPRAHLTTSYRGYEYLDEAHKNRLKVRPGITGYNQAYFRNSVSAEQKIINDNYYVDHLTFMMDVKILLHTVMSVVGQKNIFVGEASNTSSDTNARKEQDNQK